MTELGKKMLSRPMVVWPTIVTLLSSRQPAADLDVRADDAERADLDVLGDLGLGVDDRVRARSWVSSEKKRKLNR